jgi:hypothetical protein
MRHPDSAAAIEVDHFIAADGAGPAVTYAGLNPASISWTSYVITASSAASTR